MDQKEIPMDETVNKITVNRITPPCVIFRALQNTLKILARKDCEDCGGTGDVDPREWALRPCPCVLDTVVTEGNEKEPVPDQGGTPHDPS